MDTDGLALTLEYGTFEVVVQQHSGQFSPSLERRLVAAQKVAHARIEEEAQEDPAREAQR
jgi:hypothetical protein